MRTRICKACEVPQCGKRRKPGEPLGEAGRRASHVHNEYLLWRGERGTKASRWRVSQRPAVDEPDGKKRVDMKTQVLTSQLVGVPGGISAGGGLRRGGYWQFCKLLTIVQMHHFVHIFALDVLTRRLSTDSGSVCA
jgi:hypothetical protein